MNDRKDKQNSKSSKKMRKDYGMFDESDVKIDMSNENLKPQKIKVASNLLVESRVITVDEPGSKF
jgi:ABC-type Na+ transport system ATPase subunit NatA